MRKRYQVSSAWHGKQGNSLPDWEREPTKLILPYDPFALASLHKRLVAVHRYSDANRVLDKLREMATRPEPASAVDTHQFGVSRPRPSFPYVD